MTKRAQNAAAGFTFLLVRCRILNKSNSNRCDACPKPTKMSCIYINRQHQPNATLAHRKTRIDYIANNRINAKLEIHHQREVTRILCRKLTKLELKKEMEEHDVLVPVEEGRTINKAIDLISDTIESELEKGGDDEALKLMQIHHETLHKHFENGGKSVHKKVPVHPVLLSWSIGFLAKTSSSIYTDSQIEFLS